MREASIIKPQGAMVNKCTSQFLGILWCNGFYGRKWENNTVYLEPYPDNFTDKEKNAVNSAIIHIQAKTNIKFAFRKEGDRIYFTNIADSGCWSRLGRVDGRQQLNLGTNGKTMGIATHELLHALGMIHEHQRPDRDDYIKVNVENLKDKGLENISSKHDISDLAEKTVFDYGSKRCTKYT